MCARHSGLVPVCNLHEICSQMDSHGHPHICINVIAPDQSAHRFEYMWWDLVKWSCWE